MIKKTPTTLIGLVIILAIFWALNFNFPTKNEKLIIQSQQLILANQLSITDNLTEIKKLEIKVAELTASSGKYHKKDTELLVKIEESKDKKKKK